MHWMRSLGCTLLVALAALLLASPAHAQIIDDLEYRRDGADAVLHIRFVTPVQHLRTVLARAADQTLVFYRVLPTRQALDTATAERRLAPRRPGNAADALPGLPTVVVTDEPVTSRTADERRLLVRLATPALHKVRAGRGNRSIELVFAGLGPQVQPAPAAELPLDAVGRFRVTLESSEQAGAFVSAAIPASLQAVNVFTTSRVVQGKLLHETHLGPFARRSEAEVALAAVRKRFPRAEVTSDDAPANSVAEAAPAAPANANAAPAAASAASAPAGTAAAAAPTAATASAPIDLDARAAALMAQALQALSRNEPAAAIDTLSQVLDMPPTLYSRRAQALIGQARQAAGDPGRARAEYEFFLRLYPTGPDADQVRAAIAAQSPQAASGTAATASGAPGGRPASTTLLTGSISSFYYGGQSRVRTQEFDDSVLGGLPVLLSDDTYSSEDQSQLVNSADVNWRQRDADSDQRFVFRDTYYKDFKRADKTRNKLSALYYDHRSFALGTSVRVGRQSPLGGGVLGRFDGVQAGYSFKPRWKASVVAGVPTDTLLDARRHFYGASIDAEALTPQLGGSLYVVEQKIDKQVDRRALGADLRFFDGGVSASSQIDYDVLLKGLNIASLQATWQRADNTVINFLYDRRATPMLMLGNTLFFGDGSVQPPPTRVTDLLAAGASVQGLRDEVKAKTAMSTQAALGVTTPVSPQWQFGTDLRYTNTGAIAPVPSLNYLGQASTGDIWSLGLQLIGTNLYSARDTHVVIASFVNGPSFQGQLLSYNNASQVTAEWQLEPSFKFYRQTSLGDVKSTRWSPGLRTTWRLVKQASLEAEVNVESSKTISPTRNESATRTFYYLGGRYDF